jgi:GT2 family glycosyltransferase
MLGHSANLGVRRAALESIGGWDERLGAGARFRAAEDLDLMDRLLAAGWPGWYEPAALAWHDQWRSRRARLGLAWSYGLGMGARLSKLHRLEPRRARRIAREVVWHGGIRDAAHHARLGYRTALGINVLNVAGTAVGWAAAAGVPVEAGHFVTDH